MSTQAAAMSRAERTSVRMPVRFREVHLNRPERLRPYRLSKNRASDRLLGEKRKYGTSNGTFVSRAAERLGAVDGRSPPHCRPSIGGKRRFPFGRGRVPRLAKSTPSC